MALNPNVFGVSAPPEPSVEARCEAARAFAVERHGAQMYGKQPYVVHLDRVFGLAQEYGLAPNFLIASYLHDVLEDTDTLKMELEAKFGQEVADIVDSLTGEGETRSQCRKSTLEKLNRRPDDAVLKLMDRLANVSASVEEGRQDLVAMYRSEMKAYSALFSQAHPQAYARLCELLNW